MLQWDRIDVLTPDITLAALIQLIEDDYGTSIPPSLSLLCLSDYVILFFFLFIFIFNFIFLLPSHLFLFSSFFLYFFFFIFKFHSPH
jgi:hypothetical protein